MTAQHIRSRGGAEDVHAFLHLHDRPDCTFPNGDPLSVPETNPGRLVARSKVRVPPGKNRIVAYLDLIAEDRLWSTRLMSGIEAVPELVSTRPLPWAATVGFVHVFFNATEGLPLVAEYHELLRAALHLWDAYEHGY